MKPVMSKAGPIAALVLLTVMLLIFFRQQQKNHWFDEDNFSIAELYAKNLKPLLLKNWLSKEDVFNFAVYKQLPLDAERQQALQLGSDPSGKGYIEFTKASFAGRTGTLDEFSRTLGLNELQKARMDSILDSYKDDIEEKVLTNGEDALAVSADMWELNQAILSDLIGYAYSVNRQAVEKIYPLDAKNIEELKEIKPAARTFSKSRYVFVTPDTVFTYDLKRYQAEIQKEINRAEKEKQRSIRIEVDLGNKMSKYRSGRHLDISGKNGHMRILIPGMNVPDPKALSDSINREVQKILREMKVPETPELPDISHRMDISSFDPMKYSRDFRPDVKIPNVDSIISRAFEGLDSIKSYRRIVIDTEDMVNIDSIVNEALKKKGHNRRYHELHGDSLIKEEQQKRRSKSRTK